MGSMRLGVATFALVIVMSVPSRISGQTIWDPRDSITYVDSTTAAVITLARARHYYRDSIIRNYRAITRTRIDAGLGRGRYAFIPPFIAMETVAEVAWQFPGELRVRLLGQRDTSSIGGTEIEGYFDRPWFVPRSVGDSIQLLEGDFPENPALHPLAEGAAAFYRYRIMDSLTITIPGRQVRAIGVRVEPKREGPALIAGDMWLDADTYEVVRLSFIFLGRNLWVTPDGETPEDSADARRANVWANRVLKVEADLEYALYESDFWLPRRQLVTATVELPWILNLVLPIRFLTRFSDYEINTLPPIAFTYGRDDLEADDEGRLRRRRELFCDGCDSVSLSRSERRDRGYLRAGSDGSNYWELIVPDRDSLEAYDWPDEIELAMTRKQERHVRETIATLARLGEELEADMVGRQMATVAWEELADVARFNRVQGLSVGVGYLLRPGPAFWSVYGAARFGVGDLTPYASLRFRRDSPAARIELTGFRQLSEFEPWSRGASIGNSLNAYFSGHDDAHYYRALGVNLGVETYSPTLGEIRFDVSVERHRSADTDAGSSFENIFADGFLGANPAIREGDYGRGGITIRSWYWWGTIQAGTDGLISARGDGGGGGTRAKLLRGWSRIAARPYVFVTATATVAGTIGDVLPQMRWQAGGPYTVRGHEYGTRTGAAIWAVQLDIPLKPNNAASTILFFDIGDAFDPDQEMADGTPLIGAGVGFSILNGWLRPNLSYGIHPNAGLRFDLLFGAPR